MCDSGCSGVRSGLAWAPFCCPSAGKQGPEPLSGLSHLFCLEWRKLVEPGAAYLLPLHGSRRALGSTEPSDLREGCSISPGSSETPGRPRLQASQGREGARPSVPLSRMPPRLTLPANATCFLEGLHPSRQWPPQPRSIVPRDTASLPSPPHPPFWQNRPVTLDLSLPGPGGPQKERA